MPVQLTFQGMQFKDNHSFDSFHVGNNEALFHYLKRFIVGKEDFLLYLWGKSTSGLSHLLQASCQHANAAGFSSMYLPLKEIIHLSPELLKGLETTQVLCVDDIDCLAGKSHWEEAFFHLFNGMKDNNHRLIVSAKASSRELPIHLPDLKSRLNWGTTFHVEALKDEDMILALKEKAAIKGMQVSEEVAQFLLRRCSRNPAELFSLLETLDSASLKEHRRLTVPFVKEVLGV